MLAPHGGELSLALRSSMWPSLGIINQYEWQIALNINQVIKGGPSGRKFQQVPVSETSKRGVGQGRLHGGSSEAFPLWLGRIWNNLEKRQPGQDLMIMGMKA